MDQIIESTQEAQEVSSPRIGQFKTKDKFIEFVGGKGSVNFLTDEAIIEGKYLSGSMAENTKFKLTLCDNGTVDFEEVDTQITSVEERQRLLDILSEKTIVPSRVKNHFIISEVPFKSTKKVNDKELTVFLAVEYQTPISKLASIFEESVVEVNQEQDSKLDQLLSLFDDEPSLVEIASESETQEELEGESDVEIKSESQKMLEESFKKMKEEKVQELKSKIEHQQKELIRFESEKRNAERKLEEAKGDIKLLESRLDTLAPNEEPNGYVFFVSEELNQKVSLPEDIESIIREKVSKVKGINADAFMKLFEGGEYQIRLAKIENDETFGEHPVEVTDYDSLSEEIKGKLNFLHLHDGKLIHNGDMKWHDLIQKMIKLGFEQSSEFDKICGSTSYGSKDGATNGYQPRTEPTDEDNQVADYKGAIKSIAKKLGLSDVEFSEDAISLVGDIKSVEELVTIHEQDLAEDLVIYGWTFDGEREVMITDDYTTFTVKGKNSIDLDSDGFVNITTADKFLKMLNSSDLEVEDMFDATGAVYVPNFKGQIKLGVLNDGKWVPTSDYDLNDYIQHQLEDYGDVTLILPDGTEFTKLNESNIVSLVRDGKLNSILK
jgi:hypothetical protein